MAGGADLAQWRRNNSTPVLVEIVLHDGSAFKAKLMVPRERDVRDVMNAPEAFIEADTVELGPVVLARSAVRSVRSLKLPKADQLERRGEAIKSLDAHAVLGLARDANAEAVADARMRLLSVYHPQRIAEIRLPAEVIEYLEAMTARIEAASAELAGERAKPVPVAT